MNIYTNQETKDTDNWEYRANNGTLFKTTRNFGAGVEIIRPNISVIKFANDCAEFGAMHALEVHKTLNGFSGYDCNRIIKITDNDIV